MNNQTLIIYDYKILFKILKEIDHFLNFNIIHYLKEDANKLYNKDPASSLIISNKKIKNIKDQIIIDKSPVQISKLIEKINIKFLKKRFSQQSDIDIGRYKLNLNSRYISNSKNLIIKDNLLYVSHYYDGLWIWDISNPAEPTYVASYDTYPLAGGNSYKGAWGVYPLLPSGNILVSDMQYGLFVLAPPEHTTNINEQNITSVFPNPCKDILNINEEGLNNIKLYDMYGSLLISTKVFHNNVSLQLNFLKPGVYLLITENGKNKSEHKVVKY